MHIEIIKIDNFNVQTGKLIPFYKTNPYPGDHRFFVKIKFNNVKTLNKFIKPIESNNYKSYDWGVKFLQLTNYMCVEGVDGEYFMNYVDEMKIFENYLIIEGVCSTILG